MKTILVAAAVLACFMGTTANAQSKYSKDADTHYKNQQKASENKRQQDNRSVSNYSQQQRNNSSYNKR